MRSLFVSSFDPPATEYTRGQCQLHDEGTGPAFTAGFIPYAAPGTARLVSPVSTEQSKRATWRRPVRARQPRARADRKGQCQTGCCLRAAERLFGSPGFSDRSGRRDRPPRILGPGMPGIAASQLFSDFRIGVLPEASEVARHLDRAPAGSQQRNQQRLAIAARFSGSRRGRTTPAASPKPSPFRRLDIPLEPLVRSERRRSRVRRDPGREGCPRARPARASRRREIAGRTPRRERAPAGRSAGPKTSGARGTARPRSVVHAPATSGREACLKRSGSSGTGRSASVNASYRSTSNARTTPSSGSKRCSTSTAFGFSHPRSMRLATRIRLSGSPERIGACTSTATTNSPSPTPLCGPRTAPPPDASFTRRDPRSRR